MNQIVTSRFNTLFFLFCFGTNLLSAQEVPSEIAKDSINNEITVVSPKNEIAIDSSNNDSDSDSELNKWSFEFGFGSNKAVQPFGTGYNSSGGAFFSFSTLNHLDFGFRFMLNSKFGIKSDIGFDVISNNSGSGSLPFRSMQTRLAFQGVFDLSKAFEFNTFSNSIGLLSHGGFQFSQFKAKSGTGNQIGVSETNGGFIFGLTSMLLVSDRTVLTLDFTLISNIKQRLNWDGSVSSIESNTSGLLYSTSIGLTFYLGKNEKHSDWVVPKIIAEADPEVNKRLDEIETLMNDTDKDGVPDYLDVQNNTPTGVMVDTKGRFLDTNKNGTPDEFEPKLRKNSINNNSGGTVEGGVSQNSYEELFTSLLETGLINVFYDVNEDEPNKGATNNVFGLISLLKKNPSINVKLEGFSDKTGNEKSNQKLSEQRVNKLYKLLISNGISPSRLKIVKQPDDNTISSSSKLSLQLSRRVSVLLD